MGVDDSVEVIRLKKLFKERISFLAFLLKVHFLAGVLVLGTLSRLCVKVRPIKLCRNTVVRWGAFTLLLIFIVFALPCSRLRLMATSENVRRSAAGAWAGADCLCDLQRIFAL